MTKYEIMKNYREISYKNRDEIREGCTMEQADQEPEMMESFDSLEAARMSGISPRSRKLNKQKRRFGVFRAAFLYSKNPVLTNYNKCFIV